MNATKTATITHPLAEDYHVGNDAFLPPIESPKGLLKKLAYYFTRRQFGKVLTPVKVFSARLPYALGLFAAKIGQRDKKLTLSREMVLLFREEIARIKES